MRKTLAACIVGLGPGLLGAQEQIAPAEILAYPCMACHGPGGNSTTEAMPSIAGEDAEDMRRELRAFKQGRKQATIMDRIAKGYSDAEIDAIARYVSGLPEVEREDAEH